MKDQGFEIISVAEDTGGEAAAGQWFDRAKATYTQIIDERHVISSLYNMVNVPTGVWIDEAGLIVRPNEVAYTTKTELKLSGKTLSAAGDRYVEGLRDWVAKGAESAYALAPEAVAKQVKGRTSNEALAEAYFQLGAHFRLAGNEALMTRYWEKSEALRPDSWNYHRQDWSFTPKEAGAKWMKKFLELGDTPYYEPLNLPSSE